jgi:hypothetical protein
MALTLDGTNGIVSSGSITTQSATGVIFSDSSSLPAASSPYVLKNRLINSDMRIDQRNAGASVTPASGANTYTLDRWSGYASQASKYTVQQNAGSVTPPVGFTNYLGVTSSSAYSVAATDIFMIRQPIEGYNVADLGWGSANAKTVTLSFWIRSSLTGTFGGTLNNSAGDRTYGFSYTISSANTWEQKSITIAGDTTGTWLTTNGIGLYLNFSIGTGSTFLAPSSAWGSTAYYGFTGQTNVVATNGATFYITGVQLEQNTSATPFERRLYNQELANCQRYYQQIIGSGAFNPVGIIWIRSNGTSAFTSMMTSYFVVPMRAAPTGSSSGDFSGTATDLNNYQIGTVSVAVDVYGTNKASLVFNGAAGGTFIQGGATLASTWSSGTGAIKFNAEL